MTNTIEPYGRTNYVDAHRETFGKEKNTAITTSIPPPTYTMYINVWLVSLQRSDGIKLVIGPQPCIGSKCMTFQLTTTADSMSTRISLNLTCLQEVFTTLASPQTSCISTSNIIYQLRQIRSNFSSPNA
ncbi:hypothetical protein J3Q64DRAFT_1864811 [Phycomyces blakesleeanus]|uniref:Uncharacterized protein n=1 Tax=Phycomyces blakesleeanus TaxID=4837 RepID=A0ABR3AV14_PHYBL